MISTSVFAPDPAGVMMIEVLSLTYPAPPLITFTSVISPFEMIGVNTAFLPVPLTIVRFGGELYPLPELVTSTFVICPFFMIGTSCAFSPLKNVISGCLLKLIISEEPYLLPPLSKLIESKEPLKIG